MSLAQAARKAIAVLNNAYYAIEDAMDRSDIINAVNDLEAALAQQEKPAPVDGVVIRDGSPTLLMTKDGALPTDQRLYTEPPPRREWVGLTDEQIRSIKESFCDEPIFPISLARKIEDKLKELNKC